MIRLFLASIAVTMCLAAPAAVAQNGVSLDSIVAVVNDDVILRSELERRTTSVRDSITASGNLVPPDDILQRQVLERLISEKLQLQVAEQAGITVSEDMLNQYVNNIARNNGMSLEEFAEAVEADGLDFANVRSDIRDDLIMQQIQQREVMARVMVTPREAATFLASSEAQSLDAREFNVFHILLRVSPEAPAPEVERVRQAAEDLRDRARAGEDFSQLAVEHSQGQQALEGGDLGWRRTTQLPAVFAEQVVTMGIGDVSDVIRTPGAFHIIQLAAVRGEQERVMAQQTRVRHIMVRTGDHVSDRRARERLLDVIEQLEGGADFADLARQYSEDQMSAIEGGDIGWIEPGETAGPFEETMNALQPGETSGPIQTQFGWHVLQVLERREHDATEERRMARAQQILRQRRAEEQMERWLQHLRDDAYVENRLDT
jgi:peptidyl-prolyl cis-trans isomerase SurA